MVGPAADAISTGSDNLNHNHDTATASVGSRTGSDNLNHNHDTVTASVGSQSSSSAHLIAKKPLSLPEASAVTTTRGGESSCSLCAEHWVFILSTGRAGSTSILEALNALPDVNLGGENQASLEAASALFSRHLELEDRNLRAMSTAASEHGQIHKQASMRLLPLSSAT